MIQDLKSTQHKLSFALSPSFFNSNILPVPCIEILTHIEIVLLQSMIKILVRFEILNLGYV